MSGSGGGTTAPIRKSTTSGSGTSTPVSPASPTITPVVLSASLSTSMVTQACVDALARSAALMPLELPDSDLQVALQEWEHFQSTLLSHVRHHQPGKCHGLLSQRSCDRCGEWPIMDKMAGKKLKQKMDAFIFLLGGKEEPDEGFDPSRWADGSEYDVNSDNFARAHQSRFGGG